MRPLLMLSLFRRQAASRRQLFLPGAERRAPGVGRRSLNMVCGVALRYYSNMAPGTRSQTSAGLGGKLRKQSETQAGKRLGTSWLV